MVCWMARNEREYPIGEAVQDSGKAGYKDRYDKELNNKGDTESGITRKEVQERRRNW